MSHPNAVKLERRGAVLEITLDRPKANAIDLATSKALHAAFRTLRRGSNRCGSAISRAQATVSSRPAGT